jgi:glucose/arabinose dehydrogenase
MSTKKMRGRAFTAAAAVGAISLAVTAPIAARADDATLQVIAEGLDAPAAIATLPDGRLLVAETYRGTVRVIEEGGHTGAEPWLDLGERVTREPSLEEGLLDLAPAPDFETSGIVYATYTNSDRQFVLSRFQGGGEERLLAVDGDGNSHWCGELAFGADGYLYVCTGDMTPLFTPGSPAQDLASLRGKLLRLDVAGEGGDGSPYAIPPDNPFVDVPKARPEIWAYGLRNPWRFAFDPANGALWLPDVGQVGWEEVNHLPDGGRGANLGWPVAEGGECLEPHGCADGEFTWPVFEYTRTEVQCAIVGGSIYRGRESPAWSGAFLFGDWCSGELRAILNGQVRTLLPEATVYPTAIASDFEGEIVIAEGATGTVYRLTLPAEVGDGWRPLEQVVTEAVMTARREGLSGAVLTLDAIMRTRRWQLATRIGGIWRRLNSWLP